MKNVEKFIGNKLLKDVIKMSINNDFSQKFVNNILSSLTLFCRKQHLLPHNQSSSCHTISMDISDSLSPPLPIAHCFWQVFRAISGIGTELPYVGLSWISCLYLSIWRGPQEYITCKLVSTSPAVSHMSSLSNFDSFCDGW